MKKKILISLTSQFGAHTDTYMYCKYLDKSKYDIHYVGFDGADTRPEIEDIKIHHIQAHKNKILRYWIYLSKINTLIRKENFDILFLVDGQGSLLIRLCNLFRKSILDIRTGDVWMDKKKFSNYDFKIYLSSFFFKRITVISMNLASKMCLPVRKCHYLPLGGDPINLPNKTFETFNLFYIGIIYGRNIDQTIEGISIFHKRNIEIPLKYHIVGYGTEADEKKLINDIERFHLSEIVTFHGKKNHEEAFGLFQQCNVGVVYIPITYGFTCQPTTKLYEYLLAGMPVISTNTLENKLAMTSEAGVLIDDNPDAFAQGLEEFWKQRDTYNSENIKKLYSESTWEYIVKHNLEPYLETLYI